LSGVLSQRPIDARWDTHTGQSVGGDKGDTQVSETTMKQISVIALALFTAVATAGAVQLNLTAAQKQTISQSVMNQKGEAAPTGFRAKIGATVPQTLALHTLPISVFSQVPAAKDYQFAKLQNNEVLLVSPKDRQVAEIIMQPSTIGQGQQGK
jgi:hypothetical protein